MWRKNLAAIIGGIRSNPLTYFYIETGGSQKRKLNNLLHNDSNIEIFVEM